MKDWIKENWKAKPFTSSTEWTREEHAEGILYIRDILYALLFLSIYYAGLYAILAL